MGIGATLPLAGVGDPAAVEAVVGLPGLVGADPVEGDEAGADLVGDFGDDGGHAGHEELVAAGHRGLDHVGPGGLVGLDKKKEINDKKQKNKLACRKTVPSARPAWSQIHCSDIF